MILAALERGDDIPIELATEQGTLWPSCEPYWEGFQILTKGRRWTVGPHGRDPDPIPYTEIAAYAKDHFHTEVAELDLFVYLVQRLDEAFISEFTKHKAATVAKNQPPTA